MNENLTPNNTHKYWALILALMGIGLAATMYFVYRNSVDDSNVTPVPMVENINEFKTTPPVWADETSGSVEQDEGTQTDEVREEILKEIEDVENTDASTSFDESQI